MSRQHNKQEEKKRGEALLHLRVLELMASRLCHDLISPVSAINNGVELAEDLGDEGQAEAWDLIASSARQASLRLQCLRLAYGAAGSGDNIALSEIRRVFTDWLGEGRTRLEWPDSALSLNDEAPAGFAKVVLNALILAAESNAHNAVISTNTAGDREFEICLRGESVALREGAREALEGTLDVQALDPRSIHAYITGQFARHYNVDLQESPASAGCVSFRLSF